MRVRTLVAMLRWRASRAPSARPRGGTSRSGTAPGYASPRARVPRGARARHGACPARWSRSAAWRGTSATSSRPRGRSAGASSSPTAASPSWTPARARSGRSPPGVRGSGRRGPRRRPRRVPARVDSGAPPPRLPPGLRPGSGHRIDLLRRRGVRPVLPGPGARRPRPVHHERHRRGPYAPCRHRRIPPPSSSRAASTQHAGAGARADAEDRPGRRRVPGHAGRLSRDGMVRHRGGDRTSSLRPHDVVRDEGLDPGGGDRRRPLRRDPDAGRDAGGHRTRGRRGPDRHQRGHGGLPGAVPRAGLRSRAEGRVGQGPGRDATSRPEGGLLVGDGRPGGQPVAPGDDGRGRCPRAPSSSRRRGDTSAQCHSREGSARCTSPPTGCSHIARTSWTCPTVGIWAVRR